MSTKVLEIDLVLVSLTQGNDGPGDGAGCPIHLHVIQQEYIQITIDTIYFLTW